MILITGAEFSLRPTYFKFNVSIWVSYKILLQKKNICELQSSLNIAEKDKIWKIQWKEIFQIKEN